MPDRDGLNEAQGVARVVDRADVGEARRCASRRRLLSFLPSVWGDYWILGLADDYSWAVVGSPDREYLWILLVLPRSRTIGSRSRLAPLATTASIRHDSRKRARPPLQDDRTFNAMNEFNKTDRPIRIGISSCLLGERCVSMAATNATRF